MLDFLKRRKKAKIDPAMVETNHIAHTLTAPDFSGKIQTFENANYFDLLGGENQYGYNGSKTYNMFGCTRNYFNHTDIDYNLLRIRSRQLYIENMYAKQLIDRLVTSIINSGLKLEACPNRQLIAFTEDQFLDWTMNTEALFEMSSRDISSIDHHQVKNFANIQLQVQLEAFIAGDVLIIQRINRKTGLPSIQVIRGELIRTPAAFELLPGQDFHKGNRIVDGIELDSRDRIVAHWVVSDEDNRVGNFTRIARIGEKSGRIISFLVYGQPPQTGHFRGLPLLSVVLEPLQQLDTYTGYELEAAKVNAALAMVTRKTQDVAGSHPMESATTRKRDVVDDPQEFSLPLAQRGTNMQPGMMINELAYGEEVTSFNTARPNVNYGDFEKKIAARIAAALEIPPEILDLQFQNNFSASRQASIEFSTYLNKARKFFANQFNGIIYSQWLTSMTLNGRINAPGYIESIKTGDIFIKNAWQSANFLGVVRPSVDILKEAKAYKIWVDEGLITREQAALEQTGTDFNSNVNQLTTENQQLADANESLVLESVGVTRSLEEI